MKKIMYRLEHLLEIGGIKKDILLLIISIIAVVCSLLKIQPFSFDLAWVAIILCGVPIIMEAIIGLVTAFDIKADVLVSLALIASVCTGENFAAGEVAVIMQLGSLLEELTVARARAGIEKLVHLTPQTARIVTGEKEKIISSERVEIGDIIRVLPGETVPVDGIIIEGETSVNQAVMTGESLPVDKKAGDEVSSGTVNQFGRFEMRATKVGEDSSIQRMIRLVQSADAGKAKIVGLADRWATWIVVIALTAAVLTWIVTGQIIRAVTILVVFCPCALVLATPTAIMAAIGNVTKHGFLIREGDALERLSKVSKITFDKTGTLTYGKPEVIKIQNTSGISETELYAFCAAAEKSSEHPLGKAIVYCYEQEYSSEIWKSSEFKMIPGRGVQAVVNKRQVLAGNIEMIEENGILVAEDYIEQADGYINKGCTIIYVAIDHVFAGYIVLSDTIRSESKDMLKALTELKVQPVLLTGDNRNAAKTIAEQISISEVHANCLPEDKMNFIKEYQAQKEAVCMIGDGINDAPALKAADVGLQWEELAVILQWMQQILHW